jgi:TRAP-type C4-dicarboxylate transport system substrate-binding protein
MKRLLTALAVSVGLAGAAAAQQVTLRAGVFVPVNTAFGEINVLVNDKKWQSLTPAQRAALEKTAAWFDLENVKWVADKVAAESKRQADAGIRAVELGAEFRKGAYEAYWGEMIKRAPDQTRALRQVLDR